MLVAYSGNSDVFSQESAFTSREKATQAAKLMYWRVKGVFELSEREEELLESLIYFLMYNVNRELNVFLSIAQVGNVLDDGNRSRVAKLMTLLKDEDLLHVRSGVITMTYLDKETRL